VRSPQILAEAPQPAEPEAEKNEDFLKRGSGTEGQTSG
jgi:hypothetical protein